MNIDDFEAPDAPDDLIDILGMIFGRQRELMLKYKEIEQLPDPPLSLHHAHGQRIIRDFAWRSTEELAESFEAYIKWKETGDTVHIHHQIEELADSLHFIVELLIFAGVTHEQCYEQLQNPYIQIDATAEAYWNATYHLGIAMNFLRNKAWKKSQVPTDEGRFRAQILLAFHHHFVIWLHLNVAPRDMFNYYFRKSEVNKFRQRSEY